MGPFLQAIKQRRRQADGEHQGRQRTSQGPDTRRGALATITRPSGCTRTQMIEVVGERPPPGSLSGCTVRVPKYETWQSTTFFQIVVTSPGNESCPFSVWHRYSHFRDLANALGAMKEFPPKSGIW